MAKEKRSNSEDLTENLRGIFDQIEGDRVDLLSGLKEVRAISHSLLQHETLRLSRKLGRKHPRVHQIQARLDENQNLVHDLEVQLELTKIRVPDIAESDALMHGRVVDEHGRGMEGLTVYVEDGSKRTVRGLGRTETNASGYYALPVDASIVARMSKTREGAAYLAVCTPKGKVACRSNQAIKLTEGSRVLMEFALNRRDLSPLSGGRGGSL